MIHFIPDNHDRSFVNILIPQLQNNTKSVIFLERLTYELKDNSRVLPLECNDINVNQMLAHAYLGIFDSKNTAKLCDFSKPIAVSVLMWFIVVGSMSKDLLCWHHLPIMFHDQFKKILQEMTKVNTKTETMTSIIPTVTQLCTQCFGGLPRLLPIKFIKQSVENIIKSRSDLCPLKFMCYYAVIQREQTMIATIKSYHVLHQHTTIVVILGGNHLSKSLTDDDLTKLHINVVTSRNFESLIENYFPNQRLTDYIKGYALHVIAEKSEIPDFICCIHSN